MELVADLQTAPRYPESWPSALNHKTVSVLLAILVTLICPASLNFYSA